MSRKQEANDYDEFRDAAEDGLCRHAGEFLRWLKGHYRDAVDVEECLMALLAVLYARTILGADEHDYEAGAVAAFFDAAVSVADKAGEHHALIHVDEMGLVSGLGDRVEHGASAGAGTVTWLKSVAQSAADDAHDMVAEKYEGDV